MEMNCIVGAYYTSASHITRFGSVPTTEVTFSRKSNYETHSTLYNVVALFLFMNSLQIVNFGCVVAPWFHKKTQNSRRRTTTSVIHKSKEKRPIQAKVVKRKLRHQKQSNLFWPRIAETTTKTMENSGGAAFFVSSSLWPTSVFFSVFHPSHLCFIFLAVVFSPELLDSRANPINRSSNTSFQLQHAHSPMLINDGDAGKLWTYFGSDAVHW